MRYRSSRSSLARTSAAIVLPVPLAPQNRALMPSPRLLRRRNPRPRRRSSGERPGRRSRAGPASRLRGGPDRPRRRRGSIRCARLSSRGRACARPASHRLWPNASPSNGIVRTSRIEARIAGALRLNCVANCVYAVRSGSRRRLTGPARASVARFVSACATSRVSDGRRNASPAITRTEQNGAAGALQQARDDGHGP